MVDFRKKLNKTVIEKKIDPIDIYESLDRRSVAGPLRPAQKKVLEAWYQSKTKEKDLIIKLHTGEGKTLIGLLILQSKINSGNGPCLFICPNKYLVEQVSKDAKKFGIKNCTIGPDNMLPNEFIDGEKILITHVQKVFNGKTIFGLGNDFVHVENLILDDSHACIDSIKSSFTIQISREDTIYNEIIELFKDDLSEQGEGTFLEIENGDYNSFLPIPYWAWMDKIDEILQILSDNREQSVIAFTWPIIKDSLQNCQAFISGQSIEITPTYIPIEKFGSFSQASQRILMSATTQDDSFFIKGLGFSTQAIKEPLNNPEQIWSGEKMLVIPSLIDESLDRDKIVKLFAIPSNKNYGVAALVSSFRNSEQYKRLGSLVPLSHQVSSYISNLKKGDFSNTLVFANRYDGIDLPDENCRILIIDGKPFFYSLTERYEENNRKDSDLVNIKIAQKIEQGLGRSVRGEKDYSLILIIGNDLIKFIKSSRTNKYFSPQTKKQIELGMEIANLAAEDITEKNDAFDVIKSLMKQSLQRDEAWKEFYKEEMNSIEPDSSEKNHIYNILSLERKAAIYNNAGDFEKACEEIQKIIDSECSIDSEKGWFLQILARYKYLLSKTDSNSIQKSAFLKNNELLKPKEGITYKKLEFIDESRIKRIKKYITAYSGFEELMLNLDGVLSDLQFGVTADKFEAALKEIGLLLGFLSERPDKEHKKGPDNLWCGVSNQYFMFECKNEVKVERKEINKHEAGQMNTHCAWFNVEYGDVAVKRIMIIPTKNLSYHGEFGHDVEIMRRGKLKDLRSNIKSFFKEFKKFEIDSLSDETIQEFINTHKLDIDSLKTLYSDAYYKNRN